MFEIPEELRCAACDRPLTVESVLRGPWCILCQRVFCAQHLYVRDDVSNCGDCEAERRALEADGPVPKAEVERVSKLLLNDLEATHPAREHKGRVLEATARIRLFSSGAEEFEGRVVDDVQQSLHDDFIDVSWPRCPAHPHHPLWYSDGWWRCSQSGEAIAELGSLASTQPNIE